MANVLSFGVPKDFVPINKELTSECLLFFIVSLSQPHYASLLFNISCALVTVVVCNLTAFLLRRTFRLDPSPFRGFLCQPSRVFSKCILFLFSRLIVFYSCLWLLRLGILALRGLGWSQNGYSEVPISAFVAIFGLVGTRSSEPCCPLFRVRARHSSLLGFHRTSFSISLRNGYLGS